MITPRILGRLLVERGAIPQAELDAALAEQADHPRRLGEILIERGSLDEGTLAMSLAEQLGLDYLPPPLEVARDAAHLLKAPLARRWGVVPLSATARSLRLAMADPLDLGAADDVGFQSGRRIEPVVATPRAVADGIARAYGDEWTHLLGELPEAPPRAVEDNAELERAARAGPVVQLVDHLLARAVDERASDIHLELHDGELRARYRIDGLLSSAMVIPGAARSAILSRIKIMSEMDISVKRRPQDGGMPLRHGDKELTLRVSTLPVDGGEKAVLRILDPRRAPAGLGALGLSTRELAGLRSVIHGGQGVLLAAGPTGSGKSSTLYAALQEVDRERLNVVTLEDPIEYRLSGLNQVQIDPRAGLTFPAALRSVLRQDPDVIMVGEIRDRETAEIAMAAAVTGHLVLSTIHTVDAPGAVTRLLDMGVPPFLVAGGLAGVIAQRLVRTTCTACGGRRAAGCERCTEGYLGRTGVFQLLVTTDALRDQVIRGASSLELRRLASDSGMATMAEDARRKVAEGVTTPHEVARVLRGDPGAVSPCPACATEIPVGAEGCPSCGLASRRRCRCGQQVQAGWRFCAWCLRKA